MSELAIHVEHLSKRYRIGKAQKSILHNPSPFRHLAHSMRYYLGAFFQPEETLWALKNVSFEVRQGDVLGVIGRNGSGKSTLLKLLSRVTEPTTGRAIIHGRVGALLEVGTGFHPELTGRENIFLSGAILGMKHAEIQRKFDEIVAFSGVERFIDTPIKYYSSGMRVRLGFAVAAHLEPEVLLIDEVLAVGDAEFQQKCLGKMSEVATAGRTVLFVSHNMAAVQSLCNRGIYLQKGEILVDGTISEAVAKYLKIIDEISQIEISERTDRTGLGNVRLVGVDITDQSHLSALTLITGEPAQFVFHLSHLEPGIKFEYLDFTICDLQGNPVAYFNSIDTGPEDNKSPDMHDRVVCWIDELPLLPGRYRINVGIKANGEMQDHVESAAVFNVEQGRLRGRPIDNRSQRRGSVIFPHRWILPG